MSSELESKVIQITHGNSKAASGNLGASLRAAMLNISILGETKDMVDKHNSWRNTIASLSSQGILDFDAFSQGIEEKIEAEDSRFLMRLYAKLEPESIYAPNSPDYEQSFGPASDGQHDHHPEELQKKGRWDGTFEATDGSDDFGPNIKKVVNRVEASRRSKHQSGFQTAPSSEGTKVRPHKKMMGGGNRQSPRNSNATTGTEPSIFMGGAKSINWDPRGPTYKPVPPAIPYDESEEESLESESETDNDYGPRGNSTPRTSNPSKALWERSNSGQARLLAGNGRPMTDWMNPEDARSWAAMEQARRQTTRSSSSDY